MTEHQRVKQNITSHSSSQSVQHCICLCGFVPPVCSLNDCVYIMLQTHMLRGPFTALEVVNSSISEADTCCTAPFVIVLLLFCFLAIRQKGGGMLEERRDERFYEPLLHTT